MKIFSHYGFNEFVICCGYKGYVIKEYFANYMLHSSDISISLVDNSLTVHKVKAEPWKIDLVNTGELTMTGGRLKRVSKYLGGDPFFFTYGDGLADINVNALVEHHKAHGCSATVTAVQPPGRYGALTLDSQGNVQMFQEKPRGDSLWINGGYFVLDKKVIDLIEDDSTVWEEGPLKALASSGELAAYCHHGFWSPMDTLKDKQNLELLWKANSAPWKIWDQ